MLTALSDGSRRSLALPEAAAPATLTKLHISIEDVQCAAVVTRLCLATPERHVWRDEQTRDEDIGSGDASVVARDRETRLHRTGPSHRGEDASLRLTLRARFLPNP